MLYYRDRTFCKYYLSCAVYTKKGCPRALTLDVENKAKEAGLYVCQFLQKPRCYKEAQ